MSMIYHVLSVERLCTTDRKLCKVCTSMCSKNVYSTNVYAMKYLFLNTTRTILAFKVRMWVKKTSREK